MRKSKNSYGLLTIFSMLVLLGCGINNDGADTTDPSPFEGVIRTSTTKRNAQSKKYLNLGIPVFSVDYVIADINAEQTYIKAYENGFIPLVTRVPLTNITETPPPFD